MDTQSLTLTLLLALFFRPLLSADPSPTFSPPPPDYLTPPLPEYLSLPPPVSPPPPPPHATPPPPRARPFTPPNRMEPSRPSFGPPPPGNSSPTRPRSFSSPCPSGHGKCPQLRQSANRESPARPGLNVGEKLGLFFIGVFVALQVVFGTFLVYKRTQLKKVERRVLCGMASSSGTST